MKITRLITLSIFSVLLLTGCNLIRNTFTYKDKTEALVEALLDEDYEKALTPFAMEDEIAKNTDIETMKDGFAGFRKNLVNTLVTDLKYASMKAEKRIFSNP